MRLLIAISSCQVYEDSGWNEPLRDTWLKDALELGIHYKFFIGTNVHYRSDRPDIVYAEALDEWHDLTSKTKYKCYYAVTQGYDYVYQCFADTYACPERLLTCGFDKYDYFGDLLHHANGEYCQGGSGYFMSQKACIKAMRHPSNYPNEDCWMGDVMRFYKDITRGDHRGFSWEPNPPLKDNNIVSCHLSTAPGGYMPENMYKLHNEWLVSNGKEPLKYSLRMEQTRRIATT